MPATAKYVSGLMGKKMNPYNPQHATQMQAFYMAKLDKGNYIEDLWLTYQAYNGGWSNLKSEYERAGVATWEAMKDHCVRKKVRLKNGQILDFCEVNYDYSVKVYKYGNLYRIGRDKRKFW